MIYRLLSTVTLVFVVYLTAWAQTSTYKVPEISQVVIYADGARVTRTVSVRLPAGRSQLVLGGLDQGADGNRVDLIPQSNNLLVLSRTVKVDTRTHASAGDSADSLRTQAKHLSEELQKTKALKRGATVELEMLIANTTFPQATGNQQAGIDRLERTGEYMRTRTAELTLLTDSLNTRIQRLSYLVGMLPQQPQHQNPRTNPYTRQLVADVEAGRSGVYTFEIQYPVYSASWSPNYRLDVDPDQPQATTLRLQADIYQNTSSDWKEVPIQLSTGSVRRGLNIPELYPLFIERPKFKSHPSGAAPQVKRRGQVQRMSADAAVAEVYQEEITVVENMAVAVEGGLERFYELDRPLTMMAKTERLAVPLLKQRLPMQLRYVAVPRRSSIAYLQGYTTAWDTLGLLNAPLKVYLENRFVGNEYLNGAQTSDTLSVGLGIDERITVSRKELRDNTDEKLLRDRREIERSYEINVRNGRRVPIDLVIYDQVPVSRVDEAEVDLTERSGASYDKDSGKLTWKFIVPANSRKKLLVRYDVSVPDGLYVPE